MRVASGMSSCVVEHAQNGFQRLQCMSETSHNEMRALAHKSVVKYPFVWDRKLTVSSGQSFL